MKVPDRVKYSNISQRGEDSHKMSTFCDISVSAWPQITSPCWTVLRHTYLCCSFIDCLLRWKTMVIFHQKSLSFTDSQIFPLYTGQLHSWMNCHGLQHIALSSSGLGFFNIVQQFGSCYMSSYTSCPLYRQLRALQCKPLRVNQSPYDRTVSRCIWVPGDRKGKNK